jgi:hypothetical protein
MGMAKMRSAVIGYLTIALVGCEAALPNSGLRPTYGNGSGISPSGLPVSVNVQQEELDISDKVAAVANSAGTSQSGSNLSDENDFEAVASRQSIESDAQRLEKNRSTYRVIEPTDLPIRPGSNQPNIVEYALQTTNPLRASLYGRGPFSSERLTLVNCNRFESASKAQEAFLSKGGPTLDRLGLDPDGDGFACTWDPTPFRLARSGG